MPEVFKVSIKKQSDGRFLVTCESPTCMSRARDEATALQRIRDEIRYRLEYCPCSGVSDDYVQLDVSHE